MPNIFKNFLGTVSSYVFPNADDIEIDDTSEEVQSEPPVSNDQTDSTSPPSGSGTDEADDGKTEPGAGAGAAAMFSYARVQADEILAQARKDGEALLAELREQASQEAEEALAAAREEGFRQGYADGMTKAQLESKTALDEQMHSQAEQIKDFLEKISQQREDLIDQTQGELCELSMAIAEKVIHVSLKSSREVILRMIQKATERLKRREWVHIYVGGWDSKQLAQITPSLMTSLAGLSDHIKIIPMANDESGTCIIEMPDEIIDASASTQLDNLRDILRGG